MTTQTLSHSMPATAPETSLIKRSGQATYRLLKRVAETETHQHKSHLLKHFYI